MKTIFTIFIFIIAILLMAKPKIEVMPELIKQVNVSTKDNQIPWYKSGNYDIKVTAKLNNIVPLVRITQGDYHYTLYRIRFYNVKVLEGKLDEKKLWFYIERQFPTPESGIKRKDLWPFQKGCIRTFKLKKDKNKLIIVSMEKEIQQN